ncbi:hypothetical protein [Dictyobacter kobayashii]|uniref:hypothetical protein n=1 Tax=Dictyobacter kobayashii TaxID=2014872 RepID=UPI000F82900A|nr:hypothetical protein [Dictyobacter kobayashii]
MQKISDYINTSLQQAGYGFSSDGRTLGITPVIEHLLRKVGFVEVHLVPYMLNFSAGSPNWHMLYRNLEIMSQHFAPMLQYQGLTTEESEALYRQAHIDIRSEDFCAVEYLYAVYGKKK